MARTTVSTPCRPFDRFGLIHYGVALKLLPFLLFLCVTLPASADTYQVTGSVLFPIYSGTPSPQDFEGDENFSVSYEFDSATLAVVLGTMQINSSGPLAGTFVPYSPFDLNEPTWIDNSYPDVDGTFPLDVQIDFGDFDFGNGTCSSPGSSPFCSAYPLPGNVGYWCTDSRDSDYGCGLVGTYSVTDLTTQTTPTAEPGTGAALAVGLVILFAGIAKRRYSARPPNTKS
jgi:hypothetical protein